jgi:hypothetical protein
LLMMSSGNFDGLKYEELPQLLHLDWVTGNFLAIILEVIAA